MAGKMMTEYIQWLTDGAKANKTIVAYNNVLRRFFKKHKTFTRQTVMNYKEEIVSLSAASFNLHISALRSYNEFLVSTKKEKGMFIIKEDFRKIQSAGNPTKCTTADVSKFFEAVKAGGNVRDLTMIYLIANTGIRRKEVTEIKVSDVDFEKYSVKIVSGKGNKERNVLFGDKVAEMLRSYLETRNSESPYLFPVNGMEPMSEGHVNRIFMRYTQDANGITPHAMRHWYGSMTQENGVLTLVELRDQLGHSNISTTNRYTHSREEVLRAKVKDFTIGC